MGDMVTHQHHSVPSFYVDGTPVSSIMLALNMPHFAQRKGTTLTSAAYPSSLSWVIIIWGACRAAAESQMIRLRNQSALSAASCTKADQRRDWPACMPKKRLKHPGLCEPLLVIVHCRDSQWTTWDQQGNNVDTSIHTTQPVSGRQIDWFALGYGPMPSQSMAFSRVGKT